MPRRDREMLRTTPTLRLLEITGGLNRNQAATLPAAPAPSQRSSFPDRPSALNASQAFGVVTCGLLLAAIVAALIVSLG